MSPASSARDDEDIGPSRNVISSTPLDVTLSTVMSRSKVVSGSEVIDLPGHQMPAEVNEYCGCLGADDDHDHDDDDEDEDEDEDDDDDDDETL